MFGSLGILVSVLLYCIGFGLLSDRFCCDEGEYDGQIISPINVYR